MTTVATTTSAPRRPVPTTVRCGRETYSDTGRPVDEQLGSHVVLWIVDDPEAWAKAIESEGDAELGNWPKKDRPLAEGRRAQRYESAAQIRADGARRTWYSHHHDADSAAAKAASLRRSHPNPGVRYEVAEITETGACHDCHHPVIQADGQRRHHALGYPAECRPRPAAVSGAERADGEWEINVSGGGMICGYCNESVAWSDTLLGHVQLTGDHLLGRHRPTGELVVLAEATTHSGDTTMLAHHCGKIPDEEAATYTQDSDVLADDLQHGNQAGGQAIDEHGPATSTGAPAGQGDQCGLTGETVSIEATRNQLDSISTLASQLFDAIENMDGSLTQANLDPDTLSDIAALAEAAEDTKRAAETAKSGINSRHSRMEEAVAVAAHVADTSWYRA